jgi:uncharacterized membrane protein YbhN (UPF0104 family)
MTLRGQRFLYFLLGLLISAILVWALFRNIHFAELWDALKGANYLWLIPNIALIFFTMYQRAYRWKFMIAPIGADYQVRIAGDYLRRADGVRSGGAAADLRRCALHLQDRTGRVDEVDVAIGIALLGLVLIFLLARKPQQTGQLITRYLFFIPESGKSLIRSVVMKFARGLEFLSDARATAWVGTQTLMIWILMGISNVFVFKAFDLGLPLDASFVVLVVVSVSILVPSSPGFIGVYHAGAVWSLVAYGVPKAEALSCALVLHAAQYIVVTLIGFYYLKKEHLSLRQLGEEASSDDEDAIET